MIKLRRSLAAVARGLSRLNLAGAKRWADLAEWLQP